MKRKEKIDKIAAGELYNYVNDLLGYNEATYRQYQNIAKNLTRKIAAGTYIKKLGAKAMLYLVDSAAKRYDRYFRFNRRTRMLVAAKLVNKFESEYRDGEYTHFVPKKYSGKSGIRRLSNFSRRRNPAQKRRGRPPKVGYDETRLETWFERDRAHIALEKERTGETILEFWDEDVVDIMDSGLVDPRDLHSSMYDYAVHLGIIREK